MTYADTSVAASMSYDYRVYARDAAGNVSAGSNLAAATTQGSTPTSSSLTFAPVADATVRQARPTTNYGAARTLGADNGSGVAVASYLRFTVSGIPPGAAVRHAILRLYVPSDGTPSGPPVYAVPDNSWAETTVTWNSRPAAAATATAPGPGRLGGGTWVEYDVTPLVGGNGTFSVAVGPTPTTDGTAFNSREATSNQPQLVVTYG
jgi:hypothetical protein